MRIFILLSIITTSFTVHGQAPQGYYDNAAGLNGAPLRTALFNIIKGHNEQSYNSLWTAFSATDKKANGKVWDIYSDVPGGTPPYEYTFVTGQCGNYTAEGDCYNREHSWPKSYFNDQEPMVSDLFHIYPTDGYVNGKRDNDPYGIVDTTAPFWQSENGSRSGNNIYPGYSGNVFEPVDSFKGDLARTYFYMSTRYYTQDNGWSDWAMANGAELKPWTVAMLLEWHHMDPVSVKETARNNAVYNLQHNRNPFIDNPEYADCIWGNAACSGTSAVATVTGAGSINCYPNPATDKIIIDLSLLQDKGTTVLELINIQGQPLYHETTNETNRQQAIDVSTLARGMYWIRIYSGSTAGYKKLILR